MKRLRRIIFNALTVLSLLLCVATAGLWARSYATGDLLAREERWMVRTGDTSEAHWTMKRFLSNRGRLTVEWWKGCRKHYDAPYDLSADERGWKWSHKVDYVPLYHESSWTRLGLFIAHHKEEDPINSVWRFENDVHGVGTPYWLPAILLALLPVLALTRVLKRSSLKRRGLCPVCSYDLRATPDRCPECGTIPAKAKT